MTTIIDAIKALDPIAEVSTSNEDIDSIVWHDDNPNNITVDQIKTKQNELQAEYDANQYQRDRQYPSIGDQLDMQYHDELNGTTTWKDAVAKVKSDNPKG